MLSPLRLKDKLFYGWVVVAVFFVIGIAIHGIRYSFGVFFKSIGSEFGLTRAATSMVFSIHMVFSCVFAFLGGWALDRYGPRIIVLLIGLSAGLSLLLTSQTNALWQLFITYSLLLAVATDTKAVVTFATVARWFDKKRGLALGIAASGAALGMTVMAPFATFLISNFDWRMAYIVMGVIAWLIALPLSGLLRKDPQEIGALPDGVKSVSIDMQVQKTKNKESIHPPALSLLQSFRTRSFWLLIFISLFFATCFFLILTHLVPHVTDIGFSAEEAATVVSLMGGATIAGRISWGALSDRTGRKLAGIICSLFQAGAMVWLIWAQDLWTLYLFALVYGFTYAGITPIVSALVGDTFGLRQMGAILGVLNVGFGIGAAIGPTIGGLIFDISSSYSMAFLIGAVAMLLVALLMVPVQRETGRDASSGVGANPQHSRQ